MNTQLQINTVRTQIEDLILGGAHPDAIEVTSLSRQLQFLEQPNYIQFEGSRYFIPIVGQIRINDTYPNEDEDEGLSVFYKVHTIEFSAECNGNVGYCTFSHSFDDTEIEDDGTFGTEEE